jgi:transposase
MPFLTSSSRTRGASGNRAKAEAARSKALQHLEPETVISAGEDLIQDFKAARTSSLVKVSRHEPMIRSSKGGAFRLSSAI